jgi:hypothetical protein
VSHVQSSWVGFSDRENSTKTVKTGMIKTSFASLEKTEAKNVDCMKRKHCKNLAFIFFTYLFSKSFTWNLNSQIQA